MRFGLAAATIVKLNDEEWEEVRIIAGMDDPAAFLAHFELDCLAITLGEKGADLYVPNARFESRPEPVPVVDTVGAGDAFSAILAAGALFDTDPQALLHLACRAGAAAVQHPGAHHKMPSVVKAAFA